MRFPHPVTVMCLNCGQPTVLAETSLGTMRVHCGTWRSQCDAPGFGPERDARYATRSAARNAIGGQGLAA
ncbi:MAG: hypothetical protein ACRD0H_30600 [Actinomycetes bacterium]